MVDSGRSGKRRLWPRTGGYWTLCWSFSTNSPNSAFGMFALGVSFLYGVAIAASLGVLLVLAASLTLLPALLMFTGKRVGRTRNRRSRPREARAGFWIRWVGLIQRRPVWAAAGSTALLLAL